MLALLENVLQNFCREIGLPPDTAFSTPPTAELGDIAIPCFALAKHLKKNPVDVARELVVKAGNYRHKLIEKIEANGPFVNITFAVPPLARAVLQIKPEAEKRVMGQRRVMVEYSQPNTHKEFHIGHLRNVCIGSVMVNIFKACGYETVSANYIGDVGAHVAKCLWYIKKYAGAELEEIRQVDGVDHSSRGRWLGDMYVAASQKIETDPNLKSEVAIVQRHLEAEDENEWLALWRETRAWSLAGFETIYKILNVTFDYFFYESEVEKPGKKMVQELLEKGIAMPGDGGAVVVDLSAYGLETFIILKSDGSSLYATKDLALAKKKFTELAIDQSIYIVDSRQRLYFQQLFKTLELLGFKKDLYFLGYEFVTLPDGAMSSRKGNVILFSDLFVDIVASIHAETTRRHPEWDEATKQLPVSKTIALAAIKFGLLKHPADKVIVFNKEEAISVEGFSGPYILYAVARMNSILRKAAEHKVVIAETLGTTLKEPSEKKLLLLLGSYAEIIEKALTHYNPSIVAKYAFDIAQAFNDWYAQCPIISGDTALTTDRLVLLQGIRKELVRVLEMLGIATVEEM